MGSVEVRDSVIWIKHIANSSSLIKMLADLSSEEGVELKVDGFVGTWERMKDGKDGRATLGIKPKGDAKNKWEKLERGNWVNISLSGEDHSIQSKIGFTTKSKQRLKGFVMECEKCGFEYKLTNNELSAASCPNCL